MKIAISKQERELMGGGIGQLKKHGFITSEYLAILKKMWYGDEKPYFSPIYESLRHRIINGEYKHKLHLINSIKKHKEKEKEEFGLEVAQKMQEKQAQNIRKLILSGKEVPIKIIVDAVKNGWLMINEIPIPKHQATLPLNLIHTLKKALDIPNSETFLESFKKIPHNISPEYLDQQVLSLIVDPPKSPSDIKDIMLRRRYFDYLVGLVGGLGEAKKALKLLLKNPPQSPDNIKDPMLKKVYVDHLAKTPTGKSSVPTNINANQKWSKEITFPAKIKFNKSTKGSCKSSKGVMDIIFKAGEVFEANNINIAEDHISFQLKDGTAVDNISRDSFDFVEMLNIPAIIKFTDTTVATWATDKKLTEIVFNPGNIVKANIIEVEPDYISFKIKEGMVISDVNRDGIVFAEMSYSGVGKTIKTTILPQVEQKPQDADKPQTLEQLIANPPKDWSEIKDEALKKKFADYLLNEGDGNSNIAKTRFNWYKKSQAVALRPKETIPLFFPKQKTFLEIEREILSKSEIPKSERGDYIADTLADGAVLKEKAEAVQLGIISTEEAARAISQDWKDKKNPE